MAQVNQNSEGAEERNGDDLSFTSEEWTIIGDKESSDSIKSNNNEENNLNNDNDNDGDDDGDDSGAAEEAREAIQVLGKKESSEETNVECINKVESQLIPDERAICDLQKDDESDGISVITESDRNDDSFYKCIKEMIKPADESTITSGILLHVIIACLLATAIGFGIGCYVSRGKTQMSTNDVKFKPPESAKFVNDVNKVNAESLISTNLNSQSVLDEPKVILNQIQKPRVNMNDLKNVFPLREILGKIKEFLDTLCTMIDDRKPYPTSIDFACNHSSLFNLIDLKENVENIIIASGFSEENSSKRFMEELDLRIKNISVSFFEDLSKAIKSSVVKVDRKLSKIKKRLYQRVCLIENTMKDDKKVLDLLSQHNYLGANCTKHRRHVEEVDMKLRWKDHKNDLKELKKPRKSYQHPVGPDMKLKNDGDNDRDIESLQKNRVEEEKKNFYKKKQHKKNKKDEGDDFRKAEKNLNHEFKKPEKDSDDDSGESEEDFSDEFIENKNNFNEKYIKNENNFNEKYIKNENNFNEENRRYENNFNEENTKNKNKFDEEYRKNKNNFNGQQRKNENYNKNFRKDEKKYHNDLKEPEKNYNGDLNRPEKKYNGDFKNKMQNNESKKFEKHSNDESKKNKNYKQYTENEKKEVEKKYQRENFVKYDEDNGNNNNNNNKFDESMNAKLIQDTSRLKSDKYRDNSKEYNDYERQKNNDDSCHSTECTNQKNNDRKYSKERNNNNNNDNWQFKRSEGRDNWRTEKKKKDDDDISWDYYRSKARESARLKP